MTDNNNQSQQLKSGYSIPRDLLLYILVFILGLVVGFLAGNKQYLESANLFAAVILFVIYILIIYFYIMKLIKIQQSEQKKIEYQISTDKLTKLYNKEYLYGLFEIELSRAIRYKRNLSCLMMEVDGIHEVFEKYGDKYGDRVLQDAAEILKDNSRITDVLGRFDGYQFICLFTETDMHSTAILCKRMRSLFEGEECETTGGVTIFLTTSMGLTDYKPDVHTKIDIYKMIKTARKALDLAKDRGGNRLEYLEIQ